MDRPIFAEKASNQEISEVNIFLPETSEETQTQTENTDQTGITGKEIETRPQHLISIGILGLAISRLVEVRLILTSVKNLGIHHQYTENNHLGPETTLFVMDKRTKLPIVTGLTERVNLAMEESLIFEIMQTETRPFVMVRTSRHPSRRNKGRDQEAEIKAIVGAVEFHFLRGDL